MSVTERASAYIATVPGATKGARHQATYQAARDLVELFDLSVLDILSLLSDWNHKHRPPLPAGRLRREVISACKRSRFDPVRAGLEAGAP